MVWCGHHHLLVKSSSDSFKCCSGLWRSLRVLCAMCLLPPSGPIGIMRLPPSSLHLVQVRIEVGMG